MKNAGEIGGLTSPFVTLNTYKHDPISSCLCSRQQEIMEQGLYKQAIEHRTYNESSNTN